MEQDNNLEHLNNETDENQQFDTEPSKRNWNKLGLAMKIGATTLCPPLLGHYVRKKDGSINSWLVGLGVAVSLGGSIYQNEDVYFTNQNDRYLSKIEYPTKKGLEQYMVQTIPSEFEILMNNNDFFGYLNSQEKKDIYSIAHTFTNLATPWSISMPINRIQGNKPQPETSFIGNFSIDVKNSKPTVNPNNKGIGNCSYTISGNNVKFYSNESFNQLCEKAYNNLK